MDVREERDIRISVDGNAIGRVYKVYSMEATLENAIPDKIRECIRDIDRERKELEAKWAQLSEQVRNDAQSAAIFLGNLLRYIGSSGLSFDVKEYQLTIKLDKKNAD